MNIGSGCFKLKKISTSLFFRTQTSYDPEPKLRQLVLGRLVHIVDICRRPDMRQLHWSNHVTTFDAVRMLVRRRARLADWQTTLAGTM